MSKRTTNRWRRALVTGASSGIGRAIACQLAEAGTEVLLVARDVESLRATAVGIEKRGGRAIVVRADLSMPDDVEVVANAIRDSSPMIDLLVNNAGMGQVGPFLDLPPDVAAELIRVNVTALVQLTGAAVERMADVGRGSIVQISSTAAASPGPLVAVYAASKAFVASFGQALSEELEGSGVTCTTVLPGYTRTRYFERLGVTPDVSVRRWMTADDVAHRSLAAGARGEPLLVPGRGNRIRVELMPQFPSLTSGRLLRRILWMYDVAAEARTRSAERRRSIKGR